MSDITNITCPICGSNDLEDIKETKILQSQYNFNIEVLLTYFKCKICGEIGDFSNKNDSIIENGLEILRKETINYIIQSFEKNNISLASIERSLELPQRTLTKWKNNISNPTAAGYSLMKLIDAFPWILYAADNKYEKIFCKHLITQVAYTILAEEAISSKGGGFVAESDNEVIAHFTKQNIENIGEIISFNSPSNSNCNIKYMILS